MEKASKTIFTYYFLSALDRFGCSFTFAVYVTFLLSRGLSLLDVNLVNTVYFATILLAEIPTGAIADVYGRKRSYLLSNVLVGVGFFVYGSSESLFGFLLAEITIAIGATCESGAYQAWLIDSLKHEGYKGSINRVLARKGLFETIASVVASLIGSALADINPVIPWYCAGSILLLNSFLAILLMKEEYFSRNSYRVVEKLQELKKTVQRSIQYASSEKSVRFILILTTLQYVAIQAPNMQWQPLYIGEQGKHIWLGWIWVGISTLAALGGIVSNRFLAKVGDEKRALIIAQAAIGTGVALAGVLRLLPLSLMVFLLHEVARGLFKPLHDVYLNDNIPSKERATIISCSSILYHLGGIVGLVLSGFLAMKTSIGLTWIVFGLVLVVGTLLLARNGSKH